MRVAIALLGLLQCKVILDCLYGCGIDILAPEIQKPLIIWEFICKQAFTMLQEIHGHRLKLARLKTFLGGTILMSTEIVIS